MVEYKFQSLKVYQLGMKYIDQIYDLTTRLPKEEKYNLSSHLLRSATSIVLNIAEGSTGQSNKEQLRFLRFSLRSYIETVACLDLIQRRGYFHQSDLSEVRSMGKTLFYWILNLQRAIED
jgi:four helix bundle protein